jgi:hypothetical protein
MRILPLATLALLVVPIVAALAPIDAYAGADPIATVDTWPDPYSSARMSCILPMTMQVQRNGGGTWDLLARGVDAVPSPLGIASDPGVAVPSATNCPFFLLPTLSITNLVGSPSTGLKKTLVASTCYNEAVQISPFTIGGPASMSYYYSYARACYGSSADTFSMGIRPLAMG